MTAPVTTEPVAQQRLTAEQILALLALVQAQAAVRQRLTDTAVQAALQLLQPFTGWWSDTEVKAVMRRVVKLVQPAQRQAASVTDAYLTRAASLMTGRRVTPAGAVDVTKLRQDLTREIARELVDGRIKPAWVELGDTHTGPSDHIHDPAPTFFGSPSRGTTVSSRSVQGGQDRRPLGPYLPLGPEGTRAALQRKALDPVTPYERIAEQYRYQVVAEGVPEAKAKEKALVRFAIAAETDVTLAVREQYHKTLGKHRADGYRRVLHPELSKTGPCGLCVVAADRVYRVADLLPLHSRCVCEVLPIYGTADPGVYLNNSDLQALYRAAADKPGQQTTAAKKLQNVRVDLAGADRISGADNRKSAQLDQLERSYETLALRALRGENLTRSMNAQAARITELRDELGLGPSTVAPRTTRNPTPRELANKRARVVLTDNAETGPVLIDANQHYRGPRDVAETKVPDRKVRAEAQLKSLEQSYQTLLDKFTAGENVDKPLKWQRDKIADLRKELGLPVG